MDNEKEFELKMEDILIYTYVPSGASSGFIRRNDYGVKIVHVPSRISVHCDCDRNQDKNRVIAVMELGRLVSSWNDWMELGRIVSSGSDRSKSSAQASAGWGFGLMRLEQEWVDFQAWWLHEQKQIKNRPIIENAVRLARLCIGEQSCFAELHITASQQRTTATSVWGGCL